MRILTISNTPFLPANAGNRRRIQCMLQYLLSLGSEVGMLLLPDFDVTDWDLDGMSRTLSRLEIARTPPAAATARLSARVRRALRRSAETSRRLLRRPAPPLGIDDWCPRWFREQTLALVRDWSPDVVLVEYVFLSGCLVLLRDVPAARPVTVIDTHDVMHERHACYAKAGVPLQWFHTSYERERRGLDRADIILAMTEAEARTLQQMVPNRKVLVVSHGYPVCPAPTEEALPARLLFVASHNDLNRAGLRWFLDEVWPELRRTVPDVELVVCGDICGKMLEEMDPPRGVSFRGFVPSLATEYAKARAIVNLVPAATGLPIKVAEALCHGRPVIATRAGAAGVTPGTSQGVIVADTAGEFAAAVRRIFDHPDGWAELAAAATAHARRRFSPEVVFSPLVDQLGAALSTDCGQLGNEAKQGSEEPGVRE